MSNFVNNHTVSYWANSLIKDLVASAAQESYWGPSPKLEVDRLKIEYKESNKRLLFFDYDVSISFHLKRERANRLKTIIKRVPWFLYVKSQKTQHRPKKLSKFSRNCVLTLITWYGSSLDVTRRRLRNGWVIFLD